MKLPILTLVFCLLFFLPQVSKSQKVELLAVDGDTAVAYTNLGSLALVTDGGTTIQNINTPEDLKKNSPSSLFFKGNTIIAANNWGYYFISMNKGVDWKNIILPEKKVYITCIQMNGSKIYIGTSEGLYFSETNGDKWEKVSGLKKNHILSMAFDGNTIYASGTVGDKTIPMLYISTDEGKTWAKSGKGLPENGSLYSIILKDATLSALNIWPYGNSGVYSYDITTQTWSLLTSNDKFRVFPTIRSMAVSDTNYVISSYDWHYFTSTDKGKTWKMITTDFPENEFRGGKQLIYDDGVLYTVTKEGRLFLSKDNGATWVKCKWQADADKVITDAAQAEKDKEDAKYAKIKRHNDSLAAVANVRKENDKIIRNYFKGIAEMSYSNYDTALVRFNAAIASKPDFAKAYEARMKCFLALKQTENAKKDSITLAGIMAEGKTDTHFEDHFKLDETEVNNVSSDWHTDCYYKDAYGWYMRAKKNYSSDEQLEMLWKAVELDGTKAEYYIALGDVSRDRFYDVAAATHYEKAMSLNPKCEWYDYERMQMLTCGNCNGKGYRLQVNITQQKVNNTTHSTSDSERIPCTQCYQGYVKTTNTFRSVRLPK